MQEALLPRVQSAFQRTFDLDPRSITLDTQPNDGGRAPEARRGGLT